MKHLLTWALAFWMLSVAGAAAENTVCRMALILALDVSSSVDKAERDLQLHGLATALEDRDVQEAFLGFPGTHITLYVFEWSGQYDQRVLQDWTDISDTETLGGIAARLRAPWPRNANRPTALGAALEHARQAFEAEAACFEKKIDVSGDGRNNDGMPPETLYEWRDFSGITVNALSVGEETKGLVAYFEALVIRGPGAFVIEARDYEDYARAMREKLIREIGVAQLGAYGTPARRE